MKAVLLSILLFSISACLASFNPNTRGLVEYKKNTATGVVVRGEHEVMLAHSPLADLWYHKITLYGNYTIKSFAITEPGTEQDGLWAIPTSDDRMRINRQSEKFYILAGSGQSQTIALSILPAHLDGQRYFSVFVTFLDQNEREVLLWSEGIEWQKDNQHPQCELYQGFYFEQYEAPSWDYGKPYAAWNVTNSHGRVTSGNPLTYACSTQPTRSEVVFSASKTVTVTAVFVTDAFHNLLVVNGKNHSYDAITFFSQTVTTTVLDIKFTPFCPTCHEGAHARSFVYPTSLSSNGYYLVWDDSTFSATNVFVPHTTPINADSSCLATSVCMFGNDLLINPTGFDLSTCCSTAWAAECVIAADAFDQLEACDDSGKRSQPEVQKIGGQTFFMKGYSQ